MKRRHASHGTDSTKPLWAGFVADEAPPLSTAERACFANKRVLITGAGGYLGSALAWRLHQLHVSRLVLLDVAEYGLYRLEQRFSSGSRGPKADFLAGSVCDKTLLSEIFSKHKPEIVFHAAALKHVPLMESNAFAATDVNVLGTSALVNAAVGCPVSFVHVSTDKAVHPISVMGATKQIAEQIILAAHQEQNAASNFCAVRLCNVLGSTGSVAPRFARQIARGGPMTITSPAATRFFLSRTDAVRHLLRAAITRLPTGLLLARVGQARRVEDLAMYLLRNADPGAEDIQVRYTGLRAADKLHEQLVAETETVSEATEAMSRAMSSVFSEGRIDSSLLASALTNIRAALMNRDLDRLLDAIQTVVPEYAGPRASLPTASEGCR